jgi:hypothetical protein
MGLTELHERGRAEIDWCRAAVVVDGAPIVLARRADGEREWCILDRSPMHATLGALGDPPGVARFEITDGRLICELCGDDLEWSVVQAERDHVREVSPGVVEIRLPSA